MFKTSELLKHDIIFYSYLNIKETKFQLKNAQHNQAEKPYKKLSGKMCDEKNLIKISYKLKNMITLKKHDNILIL